MRHINEAISFKIMHSNFRVVLYPSMIDSRACKTNGPLTLSKKSLKWYRISSTVQHDLLMKEHVASFASVSLCSPHKFLENDLLFSTEWFKLESLPEQYSQNMGSLRNVPTNIWPLFSLVLFFLNFFLVWLFEISYQIIMLRFSDYAIFKYIFFYYIKINPKKIYDPHV